MGAKALCNPRCMGIDVVPLQRVFTRVPRKRNDSLQRGVKQLNQTTDGFTSSIVEPNVALNGIGMKRENA